MATQEFLKKCKTFWDEGLKESENPGGMDGVALKNVMCKAQPTLRDLSNDQLTELVKSIFTELDKNNDNCLSWEEFISSMDKRSPKEVTLAELKDLFHQKDQAGNGDGFLDKAELKAFVMEMLNKEISEERLDAIIAAADKNGDGKISMSEFLAELADDFKNAN